MLCSTRMKWCTLTSLLKQNPKDNNWSHGYKDTCFQHLRNPSDKGCCRMPCDLKIQQGLHKETKELNAVFSLDGLIILSTTPFTSAGSGSRGFHSKNYWQMMFFFRCALINLTVRLTNIKWMEMKRKKTDFVLLQFWHAHTYSILKQEQNFIHLALHCTAAKKSISSRTIKGAHYVKECTWLHLHWPEHKRLK